MHIFMFRFLRNYALFYFPIDTPNINTYIAKQEGLHSGAVYTNEGWSYIQFMLKTKKE